MKRASYRNGIDFVAQNDECMQTDPEMMTGQPTVILMSELFGVSVERVIADVLTLREKISRL